MTPPWMQKQHTAVITGAAGGIGLETACRFAAAGMNIVIADVKDNLTQAQDELQSIAGDANRIMAHKCDVTSLEQLQSLQQKVDQRFGPVHCLMNNAGIIAPGAPPWEGMEGLHRILNINLFGVINGCHAFIPSMLEHGQPGAIINTGSKQGITRPPGNYAYNLS
ncbi:MAG: SDR family NAD(P)-dependent oxidoreductase, partial [Gammaproteobacteria bacterium]